MQGHLGWTAKALSSCYQHLTLATALGAIVLLGTTTLVLLAGIGYSTSSGGSQRPYDSEFVAAVSDCDVPMAASQIYSKLSLSLALIETPSARGTGLLTEDGYVVTAAHVVWPFGTVRIAFPDGSEYSNAPVVNWDLMTDIAVVGPLNTDLPGGPLANGEQLSVGTQVYLLGYPLETEVIPSPTMTQGILSRKREWDRYGMTFLQTDAPIAGGQSGGALVSECGDVIGISNWSLGFGAFAVAVSGSDVLPLMGKIINGESSLARGSREMAYDDRGEPVSSFEDPDDGAILPLGQTLGALDYAGDVDHFVINLPKGQRVRVEVESVMIDPLLVVNLRRSPGDSQASDDDSGGGVFGTNAELTYTAPETGDYFIIVTSPFFEVGGYLVTVTRVTG